MASPSNPSSRHDPDRHDPDAHDHDARPVSLVVGADGLIGRALLMDLTGQSQRAIGTSRRKPSPKPSTRHRQIVIDLAQPASSWTLPPHITKAYLCAGVASIQACEDEPAATAAINCDGTLALARLLARQNVMVIYLSTNQVYDGHAPHRQTDEPACPLTEYGRQKARTEQALLEPGMPLSQCSALVRLTKVLAPGDKLLEGWRQDLLAGRPVHPFHDMRMAPVTLKQVVQTLQQVARTRRLGVTHLSGGWDITYEAVARHMAQRLGVSPSLVRPRSARQAGLAPAMTPLHTTLDMSQTARDLGILPASPWQAIDETLGW